MTIETRFTPIWNINILGTRNEVRGTRNKVRGHILHTSYLVLYIPPPCTLFPCTLNLGFQIKCNPMLSAEECYAIFQKSIDDYHLKDDVDTVIKNPFPQGSFEWLLYLKNWIDTVQWHLEDIIRDPGIDPVEGINIKRKIDRSNQDRTDTVEKM